MPTNPANVDTRSCCRIKRPGRRHEQGRGANLTKIQQTRHAEEFTPMNQKAEVRGVLSVSHHTHVHIREVPNELTEHARAGSFLVMSTAHILKVLSTRINRTRTGEADREHEPSTKDGRMIAGKSIHHNREKWLLKKSQPALNS